MIGPVITLLIALFAIGIGAIVLSIVVGLFPYSLILLLGLIPLWRVIS